MITTKITSSMKLIFTIKLLINLKKLTDWEKRFLTGNQLWTSISLNASVKTQNIFRKIQWPSFTVCSFAYITTTRTYSTSYVVLSSNVRITKKLNGFSNTSIRKVSKRSEQLVNKLIKLFIIWSSTKLLMISSELSTAIFLDNWR